MSIDVKLPRMRMVRQRYDVPSKLDVLTAIDREWSLLKDRLKAKPGATVCVCVGSRGIANLKSVVRAVVGKLKEFQLKPFITPAMGSHGGATAEGQIEVLRARGITEESVGAPVMASMDVKSMGEVNGIPLFVSRLAHEADNIVLINRIKPHTSFIGRTESGLIKMMAIGLGNQTGAEHYHRLVVVRDFYEVISTVGKKLINRCDVLFGVALVENQDHEISFLRMAMDHEIESVETDLLIKARACLPKLPLAEIDLLIVDEMGKDISGEGIDPNVVGRDVCKCGVRRKRPEITRIFVRDLTEGSEGSGLGIGQADFTTRRLVDKINFEVTAVNCVTSCCPESGSVPLTYPNDHAALSAALKTVRPYTLQDVRIIHIKNTLELTSMLASIGCLAEFENKNDLSIGDDDLEFRFDQNENLISPFL